MTMVLLNRLMFSKFLSYTKYNNSKISSIEMGPSFLIDVLNRNKSFNQLLIKMIEKADESVRIRAKESVTPLIVTSLLKWIKLPVLVLSPEPDISYKLYYRMRDWVGNTNTVQVFPEKQTTGVDKNNLENVVTRISALFRISHSKSNAADNTVPQIVISDIIAASERIIAPTEFMNFNQLVKNDMTFEPEKFLTLLLNYGYIPESRVEVPGTFSHRGGIIDIYPMTSVFPVRIELTGDKIESLRLFDPKSQRSVELIKELQFNLSTDVSDLKSDATLLDYFNINTLLFLDNCEEMVFTTACAEEMNYLMQPYDAEVLCHISRADIEKKINRFTKKIYMNLWDTTNVGVEDNINLLFTAMPQYAGKLDNFITDLKSRLETGYSIFVISQQNERIYEMLIDAGIHVHRISGLGPIVDKRGISIYKGSLDAGWTWDNTIAVFTDREIFGWTKQERLTSKRPIRHHLSFSQLQEGSYIVHIDHGIGRFAGFSQIKSSGINNEYLVLEYAAGDKLYVPVDQIDRVSQYIGGKDQAPTLSRLHTQEWTQTKIRIRKSVQDIARDLLKLYAIRETTNGFAFSLDTIWQREIESSFPYVETQDQLKAVSEVKRDMETNKPMDRLICGDVGYGKTEIALRAAFKAVMDSKQVVILVPTTVLAQQHYQTFFERLQAFPVGLAVLSRLNSEKEQDSIIQGLANGSIDICIGTHRLLQQDVVFKNLGLLIIDEEQRFGVVHKELFKRRYQNIDILTLSATPIPRTLHMSLTGVKDLSTLETPPEDRLPIKTFVGPYKAEIVREAILREIRREGQVYYVHNRVNNISIIMAELKLLVPECNILVAHGKMHEDELEKVMTDFIKHKADLLLTTTIIESGIDIPNANTMIIDESEKLGLTQLYQLRGRIGRGANTAFAYFFYRTNRYLTEQAEKRLITIAEATELGAGYAIAMKDLEIRGAGNLLGTEQSGYIAAVGFNLYCRLLADAVEELKKEDTGLNKEIPVQKKTAETSVSLPLNAYILETYIPDINDRIWFYQRLTLASKEEDITELEVELCDRFGKMPDELQNLMYIAELKRYASCLGVESIYTKNRQVIISFSKLNDVNRLVPEKYFQKYKNIIVIGSQQIKIDLAKAGNNWQLILMDLIKSMSNVNLITLHERA